MNPSEPHLQSVVLGAPQAFPQGMFGFGGCPNVNMVASNAKPLNFSTAIRKAKRGGRFGRGRRGRDGRTGGVPQTVPSSQDTGSSSGMEMILSWITEIKVDELRIKHEKFKAHRDRVEAEIKDRNKIDELEILSRANRQWLESCGQATSAEKEIAMNSLLGQARADPAFAETAVPPVIETYKDFFRHEAMRFKFAELLCRLIQEWQDASRGASENNNIGVSTETMADEGVGVPDEGVGVPDEVSAATPAKDAEYEMVGDDEELGSRAAGIDIKQMKSQLESLIFTEKKIDESRLKEYLESLFPTEGAKRALNIFRDHMRGFSQKLSQKRISEHEVTRLIASCLGCGALFEEDQAILHQVENSPAMKNELAGILNLKLASFREWGWNPEGVEAEYTLLTNGKLRLFMDCGIMNVMLLQYVGLVWCEHLRESLKRLTSGRHVWNKANKKMFNSTTMKRNKIFLGENCYDSTMSLAEVREGYYREHYFMRQLTGLYEYEGMVYDPDLPIASSDETEPLFDSPLELKQTLMHLMCADVIIRQKIHGGCTAVQTDLEWFGPSLPFATIHTVLEFFGFPESDREFFQNFLQTPLLLSSDGDEKKEPRIRKCGVPISFALSDLFGELVLFVVDLAVNHATDGDVLLFRMHDDFWFWHHDPVKCALAWHTIREFIDVAGLKINYEKTGCVRTGDKKSTMEEIRAVVLAVCGDIEPSFKLSDDTPVLPEGHLSCGFLKITDDCGKNDQLFEIDFNLVDLHANEMKRQLTSIKSVFDWCRAYNQFMGFFVRNCGTPAIVFGKPHLMQTIDVVNRVHARLFDGVESNGEKAPGFVSVVRKMLKERYGIEPEYVLRGWLIWPCVAGGLEIKDWYSHLFVLSGGYEEERNFKAVPKCASRYIDDALEQEEDAYHSAKTKWESQSRVPQNSLGINQGDDFLTFDEYTRDREFRSTVWKVCFGKLMMRPTGFKVGLHINNDQSPDIKCLSQIISAFGANLGTGWDNMTPYWRWVTLCHHKELEHTFGTLRIIDEDAVPLQMVATLKQRKLKWKH